MSSDATPAIRARGLGKAFRHYPRHRDRLLQLFARGRPRFREHWALQDLDLEVAVGESLAIVGPNGSGKSTLLQLLCGTLFPTTGEVAVCGRIAPLLELGAGFHPDFSGRENVFFSATLLGLERRTIEERFEQIAAFADIGEFMERPVRHYSNGMWARLAFAVAAHVDADILVVDEMLAVGDAAFNQKCMRFMRSFRQRSTLVITSHDPTAVLSLCDRALWLENGSLRGVGPAREILHAYEARHQEGEHRAATFRRGGERKPPPRAIRDPRAQLLSASSLRNQLEVFDFDPDAPQFGHGRARIEDVELLATSGDPASGLQGGEAVEIAIHARALSELLQPILGFVVRDSLGQVLFADNTFLSHCERPVAVKAGKGVCARFRFQLPYLPNGDFSIGAAIADGTQSEHTQHHWLDDARHFTVRGTHVSRGLVGVPMMEISLEPEKPAEDESSNHPS